MRAALLVLVASMRATSVRKATTFIRPPHFEQIIGSTS